ncbi:hypothetical protein PVAP13_8KG248611 [Panicum virgatum]|uniref:Uncharacterized protein n=1 Tax=Panicum virgatum TaxID=38727 RepID=A0A8T0PJN3_PANVG|nr:hypothetical protein PVAP13_8KG248611 [Panicum virgatum]
MDLARWVVPSSTSPISSTPRSSPPMSPAPLNSLLLQVMVKKGPSSLPLFVPASPPPLLW